VSDSPVAVLHNVAGTEVGTAGAPLRTDPTGSTAQPVSGTVTANAGTGPFPVSDNGGSLTVDGPVTDAQLRATAVPVSAASLPLPSGASTAAKQPALGTAGTPSADVISVQGVSGGTPQPVSGTFWQTTQPVSGPLTDAQLRATAVPVSGSFSSSVIANPTDTTGTIAAVNGAVTAAVQGWSSCMVVLTGTWVGRLVFEMSCDGGTTWFPGAFVVPPSVISPLPVPISSVITNGSYQGIGMGALTHVRVRASAYSSGTVSVRLVFGDSAPGVFSSFSSIQQNVTASLFNNTTTNLAAGAAFTGASESTLGVAAIQVNVKASQPIEVQVQQSPDGTNWDVIDTQVYETDEGDGRTYQAVASYFRIVATNIGGVTSTYLRIQTALCPIVEALPRALTPHGRLRLASSTASWAPDPHNYQDRTLNRALLMDVDRNLNVRARVLTDEASFRDDFTTAAVYVDLSGTCYFTNGSVVVTGSGTAFLGVVGKGSFIKVSSHADSAYAQVFEVHSNTHLTLAAAYTGATASGTGRNSQWKYNIESGGAITQTGSEILLASGTTSGTNVQAKRQGDYSPIVIGFKARITQRIANQEAHVGLADGDIGVVQNQALVVFDGTSNTTVKLRTSFSASDVEETTVTLPSGAVTSTSLFYQLEVTPNLVTLFISNVKVAEHRLHIPGPYASMECHCCIKNTGTAASTTTLALDTYFLANIDRVEIASVVKGDPLTVKELRATVSTVTSVAAAVADTSLFVLNANRMGAAVTNDSTALLYLKLGTGASPTSHTVQIPRGGYYEIPFGYLGPVNGYWTAATGSARCTEVQ
jgi:hypothetical protein